MTYQPRSLNQLWTATTTRQRMTEPPLTREQGSILNKAGAHRRREWAETGRIGNRTQLPIRLADHRRDEREAA